MAIRVAGATFRASAGAMGERPLLVLHRLKKETSRRDCKFIRLALRGGLAARRYHLLAR